MHADERIQADGSGRAGCLFDLGNAQAAVLVVEPNRVIAAELADYFDDFWIAELTGAKDMHQLALLKSLFEECTHGGIVRDSLHADGLYARKARSTS